jgi:hypothetical protein
VTEYAEYILEREQIDRMIEDGYEIKHITENLSGAFVTFEKGKETDVLHIQTADGRKYFSNLLFHKK